MGGLMLFFKNRKEFLNWAKKIEVFNNDDASTANKGGKASKFFLALPNWE